MIVALEAIIAVTAGKLGGKQNSLPDGSTLGFGT
jgi:hypothetical protein